jgi:hypothetical protein
MPVDPTKAVREKILSVPAKIIRLPGAAKAAVARSGAVSPKALAAKAVVAPPVEEPEESNGADAADIAEKVATFIAGQVDAADSGSVIRQQLASAALRLFEKDPQRDDVMQTLWGPALKDILANNGLVMNGEDISRA